MKYIIEANTVTADGDVEQGAEYSEGVVVSLLDFDNTLMQIELVGIGWANIPLDEVRNLKKVIDELLPQMIDSQKED